jgi:hypothetical protein
MGLPSGTFTPEMKAFNIYLRNNLNTTFFQQGTVLYLQDLQAVKENNNYFTLGAFYGFEASFKLGYLELSGSICRRNFSSG